MPTLIFNFIIVENVQKEIKMYSESLGAQIEKAVQKEMKTFTSGKGSQPVPKPNEFVKVAFPF